MVWESEKTPKEIALWRAVILQAIMDCLTQSSRLENVIAREDALKWFDKAKKSFVIVCQLADLNPDFVINKMRYALRNQSQWRRSCDIGKGEQFLNF